MEHLLIAQRSDPDFLLGESWDDKQALKVLEAVFSKIGGRSVELAEEIDGLRARIEEND